MARNSATSGSGHAEPGDDKGGLLGGQGADDVLPDDRGGTVATIQPGSVNQGHGNLMRFFDSATGGHFFTASADEQAALQAARPDLKLEGNGLPTDDKTTAGASEVYRFFNNKDGGHFFTASAVERDNVVQTRPDMVFEGVAFHEHLSAQAGYAPVYRFFDRNDGGHLFTSSTAERDNLASTRPDLTNEGIAFYAPQS